MGARLGLPVKHAAFPKQHFTIGFGAVKMANNHLRNLRRLLRAQEAVAKQLWSNRSLTIPIGEENLSFSHGYTPKSIAAPEIVPSKSSKATRTRFRSL